MCAPEKILCRPHHPLVPQDAFGQLHLMLTHIRKSGKHLLSPDAWKVRLIFWAGAVLVGLVASGFAISTVYVEQGFHTLLRYGDWVPFVLCPAGLVLVSWLTRKVFPGAQGSGIPQSIAALQLTEHTSRTVLLSFRIAFGKILLTLVGLLSGASIGREGPTVHIGAAIMFSLGRFAKFPHHYMDRGLILAGGAAGIAAAFNTPLAGILFAVEEMGRSFEERTSGVLLTGVFLAGITAVVIQGNYTYFGSTAAGLQTSQMLVPILVCGVVGGLLGGLFSTILIQGSRHLAPIIKRRPILVAALCGLGIAGAGFLSGNTAYGTGYLEASAIITGSSTLPESYPFMKMLATIFSYLSGIPGGIFAPSLATGAGVGAEIASWMPSMPASAIIILGMVAYFTGVVQTPITAFVIVMEMTDNQQLLLPLMATAFIAYATSRMVCPEPIYRELAKQFLPPPVEKKTSDP
ncbi:Chloride channel protein [hydrothermal vent metagenome]|uniref:Chloride channel protein n=1 Tax=hydrothermal vent metagenome TaxID=652676 RepID=A0A3B0YXE0_9ZZZZ